MTLSESTVFCTNSTNYISDENENNLKYLLSILNSKLINYFFKTTSTNTNVTGNELENIPIIFSNSINQQPFIKLVNEILTLKKQDPKTDTSLQEQAIDLMVYDLYDLTSDEIAIVESSN